MNNHVSKDILKDSVIHSESKLYFPMDRKIYKSHTKEKVTELLILLLKEQNGQKALSRESN